MTSTLVAIGPPLALALALLVIIAAGAMRDVGRRPPWPVPVAALRATVQLAVLAGLLTLIVDRLWAVALFLCVMSWVAARTSDGRVGRTRRGDPRDRRGGEGDDAGDGDGGPGPAGMAHRARRVAWMLLPVAAFPVGLTLALLAAGVVPLRGIAIIPVAGIFIGNGMTQTSLVGRRCHDELHQRHGEVEAALALGFEMRRARLMVLREAALAQMMPAVDSIRTIGLVSIPGAFVGMILGGAGLIEAAVMQLFVALGILATAMMAGTLTMHLVAAGRC
ncbi:hypothetical protein CSPHI_07335 [Corynebacterium sphenisci DSM 44792]|uniref:ABC transporter permease n=1 Tax=Corynebacterium sphenisci DSM 44792 TaxID=1437874 RepID=A0A1L7CYD3_9CORY|nr:ABC transporter permease [Corynebacterium sphenisci]APT90886.1 hypothetical protein CSPHI_07335 [Corynebacterium sphenisci DSM 44792]